MVMPPVPGPLSSRDQLLGKRVHSEQAQLFLPSTDGQFQLVPVQYLPETIWRNTRRLVRQTHFDNYTTLMTILIPFLEPGSPGPFELIWLFNNEGQIIEYASSVQEAAAHHRRWVQHYLDEGLTETLLS
ncbi:hypothetical protein GCM10017783_23030 [Deinococcus piscis]|uniref:Uncharacterized protein n=1 Tax=Deinococcus piscis TaxID=394230 RepID=A0ABQ3KCJ0_9DEIO|nr:hypothetical protein [Deinococcus piscis]GHG09916.1 hypothetical protein GCM10017783_23030 [Deinococcus piscis]